MIFPHYFDLIADFDVLLWISQEITNHANIPSIWQLDEGDKIRTFVSQRFMHGMPDPLKRIDLAAS
jgi:hypothetical protein